MKRLATILLIGSCIGGAPRCASLCAAEPGAEQPGDLEPLCLSRCRLKFFDRVTLAPDRAGMLASLDVKEGDTVRAGQLIAGLRDEVAQAAYDIAKERAANDVEVRFASKASEVSKAEHMIALETNRRVPGTVSEKEVMRLELAYERTVLQIEQAEHQLAVNRLEQDAAEAELKSHQIRTPLDGVIRRVFKRVGEAVRQGDSVLELVVMDRLRCEGTIDAEDRWKIRVGDPVKVQVNDPHLRSAATLGSAAGRIIFVDVEVQPVTGQVSVWAEIDNADNRLTSGLMADMTILPSKRGGEASPARDSAK